MEVYIVLSGLLKHCNTQHASHRSVLCRSCACVQLIKDVPWLETSSHNTQRHWPHSQSSTTAIITGCTDNREQPWWELFFILQDTIAAVVDWTRLYTTAPLLLVHVIPLVVLISLLSMVLILQVWVWRYVEQYNTLTVSQSFHSDGNTLSKNYKQNYKRILIIVIAIEMIAQLNKTKLATC